MKFKTVVPDPYFLFHMSDLECTEEFDSIYDWAYSIEDAWFPDGDGEVEIPLADLQAGSSVGDWRGLIWDSLTLEQQSLVIKGGRKVVLYISQ